MHSRSADRRNQIRRGRRLGRPLLLSPNERVRTRNKREERSGRQCRCESGLSRRLKGRWTPRQGQSSQKECQCRPNRRLPASGAGGPGRKLQTTTKPTSRPKEFRRWKRPRSASSYFGKI